VSAAVDPTPEQVRFELAPVAGGRARWEWSIPLDLTPLHLTPDLVVCPPAADVLLVVDR